MNLTTIQLLGGPRVLRFLEELADKHEALVHGGREADTRHAIYLNKVEGKNTFVVSFVFPTEEDTDAGV